MPKSGLSGSVRGAPSNGRPYRDMRSGATGRRSAPTSHPQSREGRSEVGAIEPLSLIMPPPGGWQIQGVASAIQSYRLEQFTFQSRRLCPGYLVVREQSGVA
jgi:hypothetical protein